MAVGGVVRVIPQGGRKKGEALLEAVGRGRGGRGGHEEERERGRDAEGCRGMQKRGMQKRGPRGGRLCFFPILPTVEEKARTERRKRKARGRRAANWLTPFRWERWKKAGAAISDLLAAVVVFSFFLGIPS